MAKAGRGVFANINILKGETIESCPVVEIPSQDAESINKSILVTYIYYLGKSKNKMFLALGFGSIYNHSPYPNAKYKVSLKDKRIDFIALENIEKNEEITLDYNQGNKNRNPLWFEV